MIKNDSDFKTSVKSITSNSELSESELLVTMNFLSFDKTFSDYETFLSSCKRDKDKILLSKVKLLSKEQQNIIILLSNYLLASLNQENAKSYYELII